MNLLTVVTVVLSGAGLSCGFLLLMFRKQVLGFARRRFEKIYREDGLSDSEMAARLPRVSTVIVIGCGCIFVGLVAAAMATWVI